MFPNFVKPKRENTNRFAIGASSGLSKSANNLHKFVLDGNAECLSPEEAAKVIYRAATDGKDIANHPPDSVCARLYAKYEEMGLEKFKDSFYRLVFEN